MRISKALRTILESLGDEVSQDLLTSNRTEHGDYLGIRSGYLTYLPKGRSTDKPYASKNRQRGKPARVARKFCEKQHTDSAYEKFHNMIESRAFSIKNIEILRGDDIIKAYNEMYDRREQSRSIQSCMVGASKNRFRLYTHNPDYVRLMVLWDRFKGQDVIVARALLWKTPHGIYVDRIYGSDTATTFLRRYIDKKGWSRYNGRYRDSTKRYRSVTLGLQYSYDDYDRYHSPYLDTFELVRNADKQCFELRGELVI